MVFGTIFKKVVDEARDGAEKKRKSPYWVVCPTCGRQVVRKELLIKGCYICGWQGTEDELEGGGDRKPYRTNCPECGAKVISHQLQEKGCYICGGKDKQ